MKNLKPNRHLVPFQLRLVKQITLMSVLIVALNSCGQVQETKDKYPSQVGDISFNKETDNLDFRVCNPGRVLQYYNFGKGLQYEGEKVKINKHFRDRLRTKNLKGESGFLTIRFIVNCEGKTGWFRIQGMDNNYTEKTFDTILENEILGIAKQLDSWIIGRYDKDSVDYYQYLTFKFENGKLAEIMP